MKRLFCTLLIAFLCNAVFSQGLLQISSIKSLNESDCRDLLKNGLYQEYNIERSSSFEKDLKTYFESEKFLNDHEKGGWSFGLDVLIDNLPIGLKIGSSKEEATTFQEKVKGGSELKLKKDFYEKLSTRIPDVDLAREYVRCIEVSNPFGFKVSSEISEQTGIVKIRFIKENGTRDPKVSNFSISGVSAVQTILRTGLIMTQNEYVIGFTRKVGEEINMLLETTRGLAVFRHPAASSGFNKDLPVGTIIYSYLNWEQFQWVTKNNANNPDGDIWNSEHSKWSPADGRTVGPRSLFYRRTQATTVPDYRGVFLRVLNKLDPNETTPVLQTQRNVEEPAKFGEIQLDAVKEHSHNLDDANLTFTSQHPSDRAKGGGDRPLAFPNQNHIIKVRKDGEGINSHETRPKNVSVYVYIRVN